MASNSPHTGDGAVKARRLSSHQSLGRKHDGMYIWCGMMDETNIKKHIPIRGVIFVFNKRKKKKKGPVEFRTADRIREPG